MMASVAVDSGLGGMRRGLNLASPRRPARGSAPRLPMPRTAPRSQRSLTLPLSRNHHLQRRRDEGRRPFTGAASTSGEEHGALAEVGSRTGSGSVAVALAAVAVAGLALLHGADPSHAAEAVAQTGTSSSSPLFVPGLVGDDEFTEGFTSGVLLVLFSEIGDKTFFVAMLLAVRTQSALLSSSGKAEAAGEIGASAPGAIDRRLVVFAGTFGALAVMTVISCGIGRVFHSLENFVPQSLSSLPIDDLAAVVLLTSFGVASIRDAQALEGEETEGEVGGSAGETTFKDIRGSGEEESEMEGAMAMVKELEDEGKISERQGATSLLLQTFLLVFAAEWGDRSFLSTIALSAAYPPLAVVGGASTGHGVATALAIGGGTVLAQYISEKTIAYIAGVLFLAFATATTVDLFAGNHLLL